MKRMIRRVRRIRPVRQSPVPWRTEGARSTLRVVIDTNVLSPGKVLEAWRVGRITAAVSREILEESRRTAVKWPESSPIGDAEPLPSLSSPLLTQRAES